MNTPIDETYDESHEFTSAKDTITFENDTHAALTVTVEVTAANGSTLVRLSGTSTGTGAETETFKRVSDSHAFTLAANGDTLRLDHKLSSLTTVQVTGSTP